ncbi:MAG: hypothetical protein IT427_10645 [Pirellulales bacterium]|nr:hypothetical protein [Pirellulales bacterium]
MIAEAKPLAPEFSIERRPNGVLLVRIPSRRDCANPLPDAVFTFRIGDPQYDYWKRQATQLDSQCNA